MEQILELTRNFKYDVRREIIDAKLGELYNLAMAEAMSEHVDVTKVGSSAYLTALEARKMAEQALGCSFEYLEKETKKFCKHLEECEFDKNEAMKITNRFKKTTMIEYATFKFLLEHELHGFTIIGEDEENEFLGQIEKEYYGGNN